MRGSSTTGILPVFLVHSYWFIVLFCSVLFTNSRLGGPESKEPGALNCWRSKQSSSRAADRSRKKGLGLSDFVGMPLSTPLIFP